MGDRVLVSGATGLIGRRLVTSLRSDGAAVCVLTRNPGAAARALDPSVEVCAWDGLSLPAGAASDCTALVHLAGEPVFGGLPTAARRARIASSRVDSTRGIVAALAALPRERRVATFVCGSAVGFYGSRGDAVLDEFAGPGEGLLADVCRDWEAAAATATDSGIRVVSLRTGIVLAREGGALPMLALPFRLFAGGRTGSGRQWVPWIHIDDAVAMIRATLADPALHGPVNVVAPNPARNAELATALGRTLHRPSYLPVPAAVLKLALGALSGELLGSRRCVPRRALEQGFRFEHERLQSALEAELGNSR